ncbi:transglutaminase domain-containing protein [Oscillibacter valericigenes]|uniref:transglutaminase-like domain-containing protein n=1 Tax=Oscillibacter valericigenes TaxID=351091 RepID=UPI001F4481FD|nr:transglutaminase-like domain-containing protein [Oscillibacter valericigenes]MCF2664051.1 transglutaminase domain-containing protein [Oscillibacter valericigenes]
MRTYFPRLISLLLLLILLTGCGQALPTPEVPQANAPQAEQAAYTEPVTPSTQASLGQEAAALTAAPAAPLEGPKTVASGTLVKKNSKAVIDYSNTKDGYVMVQYTAQTTKRLKAQVKGPTTTYTYDLKLGQWTVFPLSDGNGSYQVSVFQNVSGTRYTNELSQSFKVELTDEFAPFLRPNQYVDYSDAVNTLAKAKELTKDITDPLKQVAAIYDYVVKNLRYDYQKASTVKSGYLPVLDTVLAEKKGICFDYASLMTGMVRSLGIPCKLVVGYAGTAYHAWISIWTAESGWVDNVIFFDGTSWQRMDPTFASSGKQSASVMAYIGNGKNYTTKYLY